MKPGPLQQAWIGSLRAHPERQMQEELGKQGTRPGVPYTACCLGEGVIVRHRLMKKKIPWHQDNGCLFEKIVDGIHSGSTGDLESTWEKFGLRSSEGRIELKYITDEDVLMDIKASCMVDYTLVGLNDSDDPKWTWTDIADLMERFPDAVFTRPV